VQGKALYLMMMVVEMNREWESLMTDGYPLVLGNCLFCRFLSWKFSLGGIGWREVFGASVFDARGLGMRRAVDEDRWVVC